MPSLKIRRSFPKNSTRSDDTQPERLEGNRHRRRVARFMRSSVHRITGSGALGVLALLGILGSSLPAAARAGATPVDSTIAPGSKGVPASSQSHQAAKAGIPTPTGNDPDCTLIDGLVGWWPAEGNAWDLAGSAAGSFAAGTFAIGVDGAQCFDLDGTAEVAFPDLAELKPSNFTWTAWVRAASPSGASVVLIDQETGTAGALHSAVGIRGPLNGSTPPGTIPPNHLVFRIGVPGWPDEGDGWADGGGTIPTGQWTHVAISYQTNGTAKAFVNGEVTRTIQLAPAVPTAAGSLRFGAAVPGSSWAIPANRYRGRLDEVALYNRELTPAEVRLLNAAGPAPKCRRDLSLDWLSGPSELPLNEEGWFRLAIRNGGTDPMTAVNLRLPLPPGTLLTGSTNAPGGCTVNAGEVACPVDLLSAGAERIIDFLIRSSPTSGVQVFTATAASATVEPNQANNAASISVESLGPCAPVAGLVAWWALDGTFNDRVQGLVGAASASVAFGEGRVNRALHFDGTGGVALADSPLFRLGDLTIEGWLKRDDASKTSQTGPYGTILGGESNAWNFSLLANGALSFGRTDHSRVDSAPLITDLGWHHVAVTKNGTNITFHVDGVVAGSQGFDPGFLYTGNFGLGFLATSGRNALLGWLDEIGLFDRALTTAEIQSIYQAGGSGRCFSDISLTVDRAPEFLPAGALIDLTFTVGNRSAAPATNTRAQLGVPAGFELAAFTNPRGACALTDGTVACTIGTLAPGASGSIRLQLRTPKVVQRVTLDPTVLTDAFDAVTANNHAAVTIELYGSCIAAPAGLAGWWRAESDALDFTENQVAETSGAVAFAEAGRVGRTFLFDGASFMKVQPPHKLAGSTLTLVAWVKPTALDGAVELVAASEAGPARSQLAYALGIRGTSRPGGGIPVGNLCFAVGNVTGLPDDFDGWTDARVAVPLNRWSQVSLVIDAALKRILAYVDGAEARQVQIESGSAQDIGGAFYLGARSEAYHDAGSPGDRFNGSIDEMMVFDRALPGSELKRLFDAGAAGTCPDDLLVQLDSPVGEIAPLNQVFPVTLRVVNVGVTPANGVVLTNIIPELLELVSTTNSQGTVTAGDRTVRVAFGVVAPGGNATVQFNVRATNTVAGDWVSTLGQGETDLKIANDRVTRRFSAMPVTISAKANTADAPPNEAAGTLQVVVEVAPISFQPVRIDYATTNGTALSGIDFLPASGTLEFPAGTTNRTVSVPLVDDVRFEQVENFRIELSNPVGATLTTPSVTAYIVSDDPAPTIAVDDIRLREGSGSDTTAVFTLRLSAPSDIPASVRFTTTNETARASTDYAAANGLVTFAPGEVTKQIPVTVFGDTVPEPNEFFALILSEPVSSTILDGRGVAAILNDDGVAGKLSRFDWVIDPGVPTGTLGFPVPYLLAALDAEGARVLDYSGSVAIAAYAGSGAPSRLVISEVMLSSSANQLEFQNVTTDPLDVSGWVITFFDANKWPVPQATFTVPGGTVIPALSVFTLNDGNSPLGSASPRFALGSRVAWAPTQTDPPVPRRIGVVMQDPLGQVEDTFFADGAEPSSITVPAVLTPRDWKGRALPRSIDRARSYQRTGNANLHDATRWEISAGNSFGRANTNIVLPFIDTRPLAVSPESVNGFSGGEYFGDVQLLGFAPELRLFADDGNGHTGISSTLRLAVSNDLSLRLEASPLVVPGETIQYTATITNPGPAVVSNLVLTVRLDAGVKASSFQGATNDSGPVPTASGAPPAYLVTANIDAVQPGAVARVNFGTTAAGTATTTIESLAKAELSVPGSDLNPANNSATSATEISPACKIQPATEIAWWPALGGAADLLGAHPASLVGNATIGPGRVGNGFRFVDLGDAMIVPDSPDLNLDSGRTMSWDLWLRMAPSESRDEITVFSKRDPVTRAGYALRIVNGLAQVVLDAGLQGSGKLVVNADRANLVELRNGRWHHVLVAIIRDTGDQVRIFVDGKESRTTTQALSKSSLGNNAPLRFGSDGSVNPADAFRGDLDEITLWSDDASGRAAATHLSGGHGRCSSVLNATILYPLPNGSGGSPPTGLSGILGQPYRFTVLVTNTGPHPAYTARVRMTSDLPFQVVSIDPGAGGTFRTVDPLTVDVDLAPLDPVPDHAGRAVSFILQSNTNRLRFGFKTASAQVNINHSSGAAMIANFLPDTDADGMDDPWETANKLDPANPADAASDTDKDGLTALQEYRMGTNPANATSTLSLKLTRGTDGVVQIQFSAQANRQYEVVRATSLLDAHWEVVEEFVNAKVQSHTYTDSNPPPGGGYYAVRVVP